jgi:hypothetical protein
MFDSTLTRPIAREDFGTFTSRGNLKLYIRVVLFLLLLTYE